MDEKEDSGLDYDICAEPLRGADYFWESSSDLVSKTDYDSRALEAVATVVNMTTEDLIKLSYILKEGV